MKVKLVLTAALCTGALLAVGASPASASSLSPQQAAVKCKAQRKADVEAFRARFGAGKKAGMARCVATKSLTGLPALDPGQLPDLSQLPPLPPQACDAINSAITQVSQLNLAQLLNFQLPTLPAGALPDAVMAQLAQLQGVLSQLQTVLSGQLGVLQGLIGAQLNAVLAQVQSQLATVCPSG